MPATTVGALSEEKSAASSPTLPPGPQQFELLLMQHACSLQPLILPDTHLGAVCQDKWTDFTLGNSPGVVTSDRRNHCAWESWLILFFSLTTC